MVVLAEALAADAVEGVEEALEALEEAEGVERKTVFRAKTSMFHCTFCFSACILRPSVFYYRFCMSKCQFPHKV